MSDELRGILINDRYQKWPIGNNATNPLNNHKPFCYLSQFVCLKCYLLVSLWSFDRAKQVRMAPNKYEPLGITPIKESRLSFGPGSHRLGLL